jgi:hypothetical protein
MLHLIPKLSPGFPKIGNISMNWSLSGWKYTFVSQAIRYDPCGYLGQKICNNSTITADSSCIRFADEYLQSKSPEAKGLLRLLPGHPRPAEQLPQGEIYMTHLSSPILPEQTSTEKEYTSSAAQSSPLFQQAIPESYEASITPPNAIPLSREKHGSCESRDLRSTSPQGTKSKLLDTQKQLGGAQDTFPAVLFPSSGLMSHNNNDMNISIQPVLRHKHGSIHKTRRGATHAVRSPRLPSNHSMLRSWAQDLHGKAYVYL